MSIHTYTLLHSHLLGTGCGRARVVTEALFTISTSMSGSARTAELVYLALLHQGSNYSHLVSLPSLHCDPLLHDKCTHSHADPKVSRARNTS